ncbi:Crp/Fnr family transcriptional regulator [Enterobacter roggenkampii]|uniref:Crp/Fnr family transcriptional regulator n=1 Tax=Enterobacter roggenkampii TaxID=1812935 RepID=UPI002DBE8C23|nr:helix-turn-helix domain-containing protein [Enterobacter roggenkampii]MEB5887497.1 helix-turn-helix domain-containing protein [Enterobacter roggenkampii]
MLQDNIREAIHLLGELICSSEQSYLSYRKKNQRIELRKENKVGFLRQGSVFMCRSDNDIVTVSIDGPAIIGMTQMLHDTQSYYIRCSLDCEIVMIDTANFINMLKQYNYWFQAFLILSHYMQMFFQRERRLGHKTIKEIVIEHLRCIWQLDTESRENTSVYTFILARNQVSRSSLHKIMSQLSEDGFIRLQRGRLQWMREDTSSCVQDRGESTP